MLRRLTAAPVQFRVRAFEALENFRDFGGYDTPYGRVREGRLYRAGHQARATEADLAALRDLQLAAVVDLRRPSERTAQPCRRPEGFAAAVIEAADDDGAEAPHIAFLRDHELNPTSGRDFMIGLYRELAFAPAHLDLFRRYFEAVETAEGPVLIHCAAGKDRTGLLAALTHRLLGVSDDDLMADYLLTNAAVDLERRAPQVAKQLHQRTGRLPSEEAVVAVLGVEAAYLETAFDAVAARYGDVETYMDQALGVTPARADALRARLIA